MARIEVFADKKIEHWPENELAVYHALLMTLPGDAVHQRWCSGLKAEYQ